MVLGVTTGVSLAGYWLWLRPLWAVPVALPPIARPVESSSEHRPLGLMTARAAVPESLWVIQTGLFSSVARARVGVEELTALGYTAFQREQTFGARGTFKAVFAGPYSSRAEAERALATLRTAQGYEGALLRELPAAH
jgi:cell division septation protein DedD